MSAAVEAWEVPAEASGERCDRHLASRLDVARNQVQRWLREGRVEINGKPARASTAVAAGDRVRVEVPAPEADSRVAAEAGELSVLFEDPHLVALDKPAGLAVHPGTGRSTGTLAHRLLARYPEMAGVGGPGRPGIVHRLDLGTSGVMVLARTATAYQRLAAAFAGRRVGKRYLAVAYGETGSPSGLVESPIGRHPERRQEMAVRPGGRPASTSWRRLAAANGAALLEVELGTGRTHQIRVHLKSIGHPLVGDPVYGEARWKGSPKAVQRALRDFPRPALHAWRLTLRHPLDDRELSFEAPVPADLAQLWWAVARQPIEELLR